MDGSGSFGQVCFEVMGRKAPELMGGEFDMGEEGYAQNEGKREMFQFWMDEVPSELKMGDSLEPQFKRQVREYVTENYGFDPFEFEADGEETLTPSSEELESWWS